MDYIQQQLEQIDKKIEDLKLLATDPELADLVKLEIKELEKQKLELEQSASIPMSSPQSHESSESKQSDDINPNVAILETVCRRSA